MGNCQAVDAAALVIQHPNGRIDRMYWPVTASEVMKLHPGHYVSLIIPLPNTGGGGGGGEESGDDKTIRFTRVKLLRSSDTLVLGRAYRLVTDQEVMKVLRAKKEGKMKKKHQSPSESKSQADLQKQSSSYVEEAEDNDAKRNQKVIRNDERNRQRLSGSKNPVVTRSKSWRPSLQSISEAGNTLHSE